MSGPIASFHLLLRTAALLTLAAAATALAALPMARWQLDATKTRAYTLSAQTVRLLASLDGAWSVTVVVTEDGVDRAILRQVDEVLRRMRDAGPVAVDRIDPSDPRSLDRWAALLESLQERWSEQVVPFRARLDEATRAFVKLREFAGAQQSALERLGAAADGEAAAAFETTRAALVQLTLHGDGFLDALGQWRNTTPSRPIPDDEAARAALLASHRQWSEQLHAVARIAERLATGAADGSNRQLAREIAQAHEAMALELRQAQDRLARLPALGLSDLSRAVAEGEAAIVSGPQGTTAVPSWQLFPRLAGGEAADTVRFDRRFRGEQVLAAAIRSLLEPLPTVTFVHAEDRSLLRPSADGSELHAAADALRAARLEVREWSVGESAPPDSATERAGGNVWVIVPPLTRRGVDTTPAERLLLERARALMDRGEPVLVTVARSLLPAFRRRDPWAVLVAELGIEADTGSVIFELDRTGAGRGAVRPWQVVDRGASNHALADVIDGMATLVTHPTPLRPLEGAGRIVHPIVAIEPSAARWIEADWRTEGQQRTAPPDGAGLEGPTIVVAAVELRSERHAGMRRAVVVGSGGWLHSSVFGDSEALGGGRLALTSPGNRELLLGAVHWLAGLDDLVVPGPSGREVSRLTGLHAQERLLWSTLAIIGLPAATLAVGGLVTLRRRRT